MVIAFVTVNGGIHDAIFDKFSLLLTMAGSGLLQLIYSLIRLFNQLIASKLM